MARCATDNTKGFFFGYIWKWYMSAQIIGNLSGALLIEKETGVSFFIIMSGFAILFTFGFFFIKMPIK